jgi:DNA-binding IclR family transcriptional regulator
MGGMGMVESDTHVADWLRLIRAEYLEMPGLQLTQLQAQRLWGLEPATCERLLSALIDVKFLERTSRGSYARADRS